MTVINAMPVLLKILEVQTSFGSSVSVQHSSQQQLSFFKTQEEKQL